MAERRTRIRRIATETELETEDNLSVSARIQAQLRRRAEDLERTGDKSLKALASELRALADEAGKWNEQVVDMISIREGSVKWR